MNSVMIGIVPVNLKLLRSSDWKYLTICSRSETDWDSLYEVEEEETELDMKNNGSVITHLLSQARIPIDVDISQIEAVLNNNAII